MNREVTILMDGEPTDVEDCPAIFDDGGNIARKALEGKRMSDKECEEFVCDYCGTELDETDEYHTTFHTCDKDCYMKMVGLSWSDFI